MNWKTFFAMLARDAHVARRNTFVLLLQTFLQPLMFVFIFGRVMVRSGYMPAAYKSLLLPGIMAISMVFTGVWAVAMPLIAEFQFTREIEDRLLAPMEISWVAIEKIFAGAVQALISGLVVIPAAWLILRPGVELNLRSPLSFAAITVLVALFCRLRRSGSGMQRQPEPHRADVQHGADSDDLLWLHLLSLERAAELPDPAESGAHKPAGLCQRRTSRSPRPAVSSSLVGGRAGGIGDLRRVAADSGTAAISQQGRELIGALFVLRLSL